MLADATATPPELSDGHGVPGGLHRTLTVRDLTAFGVAAIIGAGIFSTIGRASFDGGPAVSLLFIFTAIACAFSALCYAQFAATVPVSGSAYTYAYTAFGELAAWIIGWALIMEYGIGNIVVAISWSDYFTGLLGSMGVHLPPWLTTGYQSAAVAAGEVQNMLAQGLTQAAATTAQREAYAAWTTAPKIGSIPLVVDLPAFLITALITAVVYVGIQESRRAANLMVLLKLVVVVIVIVVGFTQVDFKNWTPFAPNGISGVMKGVSAVFFAYIGFDAISTTAEECKNPQRDLPRAMFYALIICTVLYVLIALVLTGMVSYKELNVGDPLAFVFGRVGMEKIGALVAVSAIFAMASVLLVFQLGQPRIWMAMARDGLLPGVFARIHPRFRTPSFATIVTGCLVGFPALVLRMELVTDLTSIGTLFAFALVCGGILVIDPLGQSTARYKVPYVNGRYLIPWLFLLATGLWFFYRPIDALDWLNDATFFNGWSSVDPQSGAFRGFAHQIPFLVFVGFWIYLGIAAFRKQLSALPILGLLINLYLMTQLGIGNWTLFGVWLVIGLAVYFGYGVKHSKLALKG
ncbi:MAG: amino acid permease [Hymenobacteraceae bacterium]|nr:amino acid permease [Hymenobacteraceae bacterium]